MNLLFLSPLYYYFAWQHLFIFIIEWNSLNFQHEEFYFFLAFFFGRSRSDLNFISFSLMTTNSFHQSSIHQTGYSNDDHFPSLYLIRAVSFLLKFSRNLNFLCKCGCATEMKRVNFLLNNNNHLFIPLFACDMIISARKTYFFNRIFSSSSSFLHT